MNGKEMGTGESLGVEVVMKHCRPLRECWRETKWRPWRAKNPRTRSENRGHRRFLVHCHNHPESPMRLLVFWLNRWTRAGRWVVCSAQTANLVVHVVCLVRHFAFVEEYAVGCECYRLRKPSFDGQYPSISVGTS